MVERFIDQGKSIYDFTNRFLIKCPKCKMCAIITTTPKDGSYFVYEKRTLICKHCGHIEEKQIMNGIGSKEYPLWLEASCCGELLWAYNEEHLEYIENYVRATLRESIYDENLGWKNQSLVSRLPRWIKDSKNREKILKCINKLKETI